MEAIWTQAVEPNVMTNELLKTCALKSFCETPEAMKIVEKEGIQFPEIEVLNLDFKNILSITNLRNFHNLKRLQLCSNRIEKMEGFGELVNLVYLDLSFNNITEIGGLENLVNLEDLSLTNNKIETVKHLDNQKVLKLLSLKNNMVKDYGSVKYLFGFKTLRSVTFQGCPIEDDKEFGLKILAFVPSIFYKDYRLVDEAEKRKAKEKYRKEVEALEREAIEKEKLLQAMSDEENLDHKKAFVEDLSGIHFVESFLSQNPNRKMLLEISLMEGVLTKFRNSFIDVCKDWVETSLKELKQRESEKLQFVTAISALKSENLDEARGNIREFSEFKENLVLKMTLVQKTSAITAKEFEILFNTRVASVRKTLMSHELPLHRSINELFDMYLDELSALVDSSKLTIQTFVKKLQDMKKQLLTTYREFYSDFYSKPPEEKQSILDSHDISEAKNPNLFSLLQDEEKVLSELHFTPEPEDPVTEKGDVIVSKLQSWVTDELSKSREEELERHRQRIVEMTFYFERARKYFNEILKYVIFIKAP